MYSLGEVEALSKKASKAAGLSWGEAAEVGRAIRSLAKFELPSVEAFTPFLNDFFQRKIYRPNTLEEIESNGKPLVGFFLGLHIIDFEFFRPKAEKVKVLRFEKVIQPLTLLGVLLPIVNNGVKLEVFWKNFSFSASPNAHERHGKNHNPKLEQTLSIHFSICKEKKLDSFINRIRVKRKDWKNLEELAFKTYVPESKISREKGAGSGDLIDD